MQHQGAVEFAARAERGAELAAQPGVHIRVAVAIDERQHALVERRGAHHVAAPPRDVAEILRGGDLEVSVAALARAPAHGFVRGKVLFAAAQDVFPGARHAERGERVGLHVTRLEERLRVGHAPRRGIEQGALFGAWYRPAPCPRRC